MVKGYNSVPGHLCFVFCSDEHLLKVNQQFLQHDYFTDIITFDYTEENRVSGDLMISIDRVKDNALTLNIPFEVELNRVMIHGVLHLLGFKDKTSKESEKMRILEAQALAQLSVNQ